MMGFLTRSIHRRIQASLIGICIATYVATSLVVYSGARNSILDANRAALDQLADLKYRQLANGIDALATDLAAWSELEVMNDLVSGDIDKRIALTLEKLKRLYGLTGDIYAFDAAGKLIASSRPGANANANANANAGGAVRLPVEWQGAARHLTLIDKETDPMSGGQIVAMAIPVYGSFDRAYRTGTLVLTYPWPTVEKQLFSLESGTILLRTGPPARVLAADRDGPGQIAGKDGEAADGYIVGRSVPRDGLIGGWQVVTWQEAGTVSRPLRRVALELVLLGLFLGAPIVFLGRWLSRRLTAPIAALTEAVREIADTDRLDARVPISSADEFGTLARAFNRMAENLQKANLGREKVLRELAALNQSLEAKIAERTAALKAAMTAQQRLIRDISHEIKSPLARLSVALGLVRRRAPDGGDRQFDRMEKEIENISALASELLTLERLEGAADTLTFAEIDLGDLAEGVVADAVFEMPPRRPDVTLHRPHEVLRVHGDAALLRRAIENVVRNAIFYTTVGTPVEILLSRKEQGMAAIEIRDRGLGVPAEALAHLFEPFYRVDEARTRKTGGSGIGLAICQRAVQLHGGSVEARGNRPEGLIVEIRLPLLVPTGR